MPWIHDQAWTFPSCLRIAWKDLQISGTPILSSFMSKHTSFRTAKYSLLHLSLHLLEKSVFICGYSDFLTASHPLDSLFSWLSQNCFLKSFTTNLEFKTLFWYHNSLVLQLPLSQTLQKLSLFLTVCFIRSDNHWMFPDGLRFQKWLKFHVKKIFSNFWYLPFPPFYYIQYKSSSVSYSPWKMFSIIF